jgi:hypothetical protein
MNVTNADRLALEAEAKRCERKCERWIRKGYRTDAPKVARARALAAAIRRLLSTPETQ